MTDPTDKDAITEEGSFLSAMYGIDNATSAAPNPILPKIHGDLTQTQHLAALVIKQQAQIEQQEREIKKLWAKIDHMSRGIRLATGALDDVYRELDTKVTIQDR